MKKTSLFLIGLLAWQLTTRAQSFQSEIYPTNWWVGMQWNNVQLMIHQKDIGLCDSITMLSYEGVKLNKVHRVEGKNYLFLDISIAANTKPGKLAFVPVTASKNNKPLYFELKERRAGNGILYAQGVNTKDFIYLIMPDRFSNGDESNDRIAGMRDQTLRRDTVFNRHGGDLKGIQNHLDYLYDLGVTTLWLNPVIENDMPNRTEHGYAFTNHYKVDPRLGGEQAYTDLINAVHKKGMKIIQDAVYNHIGSYHVTVLDPPMKDWLHQWKTYTNTSYKDQVMFDPYASKKDYKQFFDGWFTTQMPDVNQSNPYVANFLIQHAIWSVENFGIDGWRIDTYAYN
ncbi:MAG TPA: alpha-amylase family glycosyl hydrolase, partial [Ferruginibacter sp.]|nr:alpha-amylase family glycosyl hydrolase [Ferruginibacter sp.]